MNIVEPIRKKKDIRKIEKFLAKKNKRDLLMFTMGTNSGLRISDILALDIKDVKNKSHIEIVEKKTGKHKKFPINSKLKDLINKFINEAYRYIGMDCKIGTHSLRKTFGYHHYQQFKDVVLLQKIFNHSSPSTTLRYIGIEQEEIDQRYNNFIL